MMQYEKDLIYKILPNLTKEIERLADELHVYNENTQKQEKKTEEHQENMLCSLANINESLKYLR